MASASSALIASEAMKVIAEAIIPSISDNRNTTRRRAPVTEKLKE